MSLCLTGAFYIVLNAEITRRSSRSGVGDVGGGDVDVAPGWNGWSRDVDGGGPSSAGLQFTADGKMKTAIGGHSTG